MKAGAMQGLALALVVDTHDPISEGRIKVSYPWLDADLKSEWIPVMGGLAGDDRGIFFMPEIDDEVVVGFLLGDFDHPVVLGSLWNGRSPAPSRDPRQRMIRSKNGHTIRFVDSSPTGGDMGALIVEDAHGNLIVMANGMILMKGIAVIQIDAPVVTIAGRVVTPSSEPI